MKRALAIFYLLTTAVILFANGNDSSLVLKFDMKEEVGPALWRKTDKAFAYAEEINADLVIIHMNTYGGLVLSADSIRTKILNSNIPVYVFIDNNAASAGALISIACDKIYMRPGANIGAATVVNQTGEQMPDKYQSYMRSTMRATAEAHGKDTIINGNDTTYRWIRDPAIAEAMVDPDVKVNGVIDSGKVVTFTANEAMKYNFCDGIVDSMQELLDKENLQEATIKEYKPTAMDKLIGWLVNPVLQSILIMAIFGGIYFEMQTPGIGFPIVAALLAAILYFAPLYLEGIANNWEIAIFFVGVILIAVEIFAIPGFGVAGVTGIILTVTGLTLAMVDTFEFDFVAPTFFIKAIFKAMFLVLSSLIVSIVGSIYLSNRLFESSFIGSRISLQKAQITSEGYVGVDTHSNMIGKEGKTETVLMPSGSVIIEGEVFDAIAEYGFIEKGESIKVTKSESSQIYVIKI